MTSISQGLRRQVHRKRHCGTQWCTQTDAFSALDHKGIEGSDPSSLALTTCHVQISHHTVADAGGVQVTAVGSRTFKPRARQFVQGMNHLFLV